MKKNLLLFVVFFAFQITPFLQNNLKAQETVFLYTFDETPLTPFQLDVKEALGYSIDDDFVVDSALSLTGISIPGSSPVAEGISVSHYPTQLETDRIYGFSFTGSAESERAAHLFIGMNDDPGTAFLDTTFTIKVDEDTYSFEFVMEGVTTDSALISLELGLSDVSTTLDDFLFERITRLAVIECFEFEAESAAGQDLFAPWYVVDSISDITASACGGKYIACDSSSSSGADTIGHAIYTFDVQNAGQFQVWVKGIAEENSASNDSYYAKMDDGDWYNCNGAFGDTTAWTWQRIFKSRQPVTFDLEPGTHTLSIVYRESGLIIDKLVVTNDLTADPNPDDCSLASCGGGNIEFEAESAEGQELFTPWYVVDSISDVTATACGGKYIACDVSSSSGPDTIGHAVYNFEITSPGQYQVWTRGIAEENSAGNDSYYAKMDDGDWYNCNGAFGDTTAWAWERVFKSGNPVTFDLEAGSHSLYIAYRESGLIFDKFVITRDLITVPEPEDCSLPSPSASESSDTLIFADVTNNPLEPIILDVKEGYEVDDTYEYVHNGELIIDPITIPAQPQDSGIQVSYGPIAIQANRVYNLSFTATASDLRQAHILLGTKAEPGLILDVPFIMLNTQQKYNFEFAAEDANLTDSAYFYLEFGSSDVAVRIDSISLTEGFPDVEEECFVFEAEDFANQELFAPFEVFEDTAACEGNYVMSLIGGSSSEPVDSGRITIEFEVKKRAAFVIWWRVLAPAITDDSFWWIMDGEVHRNNLIEGSTEWIWDQVKKEEDTDIDPFIFDLRPGKHVFEVIIRESKTQLDKLFITNQLGVAPEGCDVCGTPTSVQSYQELSSPDVLIYPNPASTQVTIETNNDKTGMLKIFNISGKLVSAREIQNRSTMDISSLKRGLYIFEYTSEMQVSRKKIIIQ